jgi:hypothetical protein
MDERTQAAIVAQMSFSNALCRLKAGRKVTRVAEPDLALVLRVPAEDQPARIVFAETNREYEPAQEDLLAEDWIEVDPPELRS